MSSRNADRRFFGIGTKYRGPHMHQDVSDEYEQRFSEDPMFEETGPNARVWRTYLSESAAFDESMIGEARDGLDAMLIFAGLFSAVVVSFVVQTYQNLQLDPAAVSASLLFELIAVQRAVASGASVKAIPASPLNPTTQFTASTRDVWVNGLWLVSLTLSLVVALGSVLVKQWLHRYVALGSGTARSRSHIRHFRYIGFVKWQVLGIIGSLPIVMHLSLALFFLGLVMFLIPLNVVLACIIGGITLVVITLYVISNLLPAFYPQCPYQTPLSESILALGSQFRSVATAPKYRHQRQADVVSDKDTPGIRDSEKDAVKRMGHSLSVQAFHWLYGVSFNPSVHTVVLQALGGLPFSSFPDVRELFDCPDILPVYQHLLLNCTSSTGGSLVRQALPGMETTAERLARAALIYDHTRRDQSEQRIEATTFPVLSEPTYMATSLASFIFPESRSFLSPSDYSQFILSHHHSRLPPLVWMSLVRNSLRDGGFSDYHQDPSMFETMFPAVWDLPGHTGSTGAEHSDLLCTMGETIRLYMHEEFCDSLSAISVNVNAPRTRLSITSNAAEVLMATMEIALHHVSSQLDSSDFESARWKIISYVLERYSLQDASVLAQMTTFFAEFIVRLIEQTDVCCARPERIQPSEAALKCREHVLFVYLRTRQQLVASATHQDPHSTEGSLNSLRRVVRGIISEIPHAAISTKAYSVAFTILQLALEEGCSAAFQIIVEYDCLELLWKYPHKINFTGALVSRFVYGLVSNMVEPAAKNGCVDYLYERNHLRITIVYLTMETQIEDWLTGSEKLKAVVKLLVSLRPDESYWADCRHWLILVSKWFAGVLEAPKFDELELDEEWETFLIHFQRSGNFARLQEAIRVLDKLLPSKDISTKPITEVMMKAQDPLSPYQRRQELRWKLPRMPRRLEWRSENKDSHEGPTDVDFHVFDGGQY